MWIGSPLQSGNVSSNGTCSTVVLACALRGTAITQRTPRIGAVAPYPSLLAPPFLLADASTDRRSTQGNELVALEPSSTQRTTTSRRAAIGSWRCPEWVRPSGGRTKV